MRKGICICIAASILLAMTPYPACAEAHDEYVTQDGIVYRYMPVNDQLDGYDIWEVTDESVKAVTIPAQIDGVDVLCTTNVFGNCVNLEAITVEDGSRYLYDEDGVLFSRRVSDPDIHDLVSYPCAKPDTTYTIPAGTSLIHSNWPFRWCRYLTRVDLPDPDGVNPCTELFSVCPALVEINGIMEPHGPFRGTGETLRKLSLGGTDMSDVELKNSPALEELTVDEQAIGSNFQIKGTKVQTLRIPQSQIDNITGYAYLCETEETYRTACPTPADVFQYIEDSTGFGICVEDCPELEQIILPYGAVRCGVVIRNCPKLQRILIEPRDDVYALLKERYTEAGQGLEALDHVKYEGYLKIVDCPKLAAIDDTYPRLYIAQMAEEPTDATVFYGDLDGNETIDILDVIALNKALLGQLALGASYQKAADVNADGTVDTTDALVLLRYTVHLEDKLG